MTFTTDSNGNVVAARTRNIAVDRLPSVKALSEITTWPKELRQVLECVKLSEIDALLDSEKPFGESSTFGNFKATNQWVKSCYNPPSFHDLKMSMADELCETCGVEYIEKGSTAKSPAIEYLNAGDTYAATLLYVNGRYRVGCWGDIVERGNYA
jgi:hypothetical protein